MTLRALVLTALVTASGAVAEGGNRVAPPRGAVRPYRPDRLLTHSHTVEFDLKYDLSVPGETRRIEFRIALPQSMEGRQNIVSVTFSPNPSRVFESNGNRYAEFVFDQPDRHVNVTITIQAEIFKYDLLTARLNRRGGYPQDDRLDEFLKHEKCIEKDHPEIQQIAGCIEGEADIDIVKNIYDYVLDNMEYSALGRRELGAAGAAQSGKGDCTEYSDLFVALCRAKGVPARMASGYTVGFGERQTGHSWVEAYLQGYGWVPFDPTAGDVQNPLRRGTAFSNLGPVYVYVSHVRTDPVLRNYNLSAYRYWGDRITVKNSVEFKHFAPFIPDAR